jgi:hypothetical protein
VLSSKIVTIEFWPDLEIAHPGAASTRRHYLSHPGMRFPVRAMAGFPGDRRPTRRTAE